MIHSHVFHYPAASAVALDVQAHRGALAGDVAHHHVADAPRHLAAQRHRGGPVVHNAIGDGHVFGGPVHPQSVRILPRLEDDRVVTVVQIAVGNPHVLAGIDHDAVGERTGVRLNVDVANDGIRRVQQVDRPEWRTYNMNALDQDILGFHEADKVGTQGRRGLQIFLLRLGRFLFQQFPKVRPDGPKRGLALRPANQLGPFGVVGLDRAPTGDSYVLHVGAGDQWHRRQAFDALRPPFRERKFSGREVQRRPRVDVEHQIADQFDGASDIIPGRKVHRSPARSFGRLNGGADGVGSGRGTIVVRAVIHDIEHRRGAPSVGADQQKQRRQKPASKQ